MTPFLQFRLWSRQGPTSERLAAALVGVIVIALVAWAVVPSATGSSSSRGGATALASSGQSNSTIAGGTGVQGGPVVGGVGTAPGQAGVPAVTPGGSPAPAGAGTTSGPSGGVASGNVGSPVGPAAGSQCAGLKSSDSGVTPTQITLGVILVDLGQLNAAIGIPTFQDEEKAYNAIFDSYNKQGGVQCRKLVARYYRDNVLDTSGEQAACLQIQQDGVFAVLNNFDTPQEFNCLAQRHIPNVFYTSPHTPAMRQYWPYVMSYDPDYDRLVKDYVAGVQQLGLLKGQKIGVLLQSCYAELNSDIMTAFDSVGISSSKLPTYNFGCPAGASDTPDQAQQAALQFKSAGVTLVMETARNTVVDFANAAQNQGYTPKYAIMNDQSMSLIADNSAPPPTSLNGMVAITTDAEGEFNTPGFHTDPATLACAQIMNRLGLSPPDDQHRLAGQLDGSGCDTAAVLVAAMTHAPTLTRTALAAGLAQAGPLALSYPAGQMRVSDPNVPTGGPSWRPAQWYTSCRCFRITDLQWRPGY
ncbi:MAG: ABC transporter substrate-binding protein [Acidimicrobiales bacterium]